MMAASGEVSGMKLELTRVSRRPPWPLWAVVVAGVWALLVAVGATIEHAYHADVSLCAFRRLTGLPCPTCGMTRGVLALLGGHPLSAWMLNPLCFTVLALWAAALVTRCGFRRRLHVILTNRQRRAAYLAAGAALLANWAYVIAFVG